MDPLLRLSIIDSATKYPSIDTLHVLDERHRATAELTDIGALFADQDPAAFTASEKIDGMNVRFVIERRVHPCGGVHVPHAFAVNVSSDWVIGARDTLVTARGDRIPNPVDGVAEYFRPLARRLHDECTSTSVVLTPHLPHDVTLIVVAVEFFGGKIGRAARKYAQEGTVGFRVFDVRMAGFDAHEAIMRMPIPEIAARRDRGTLPGRWLTNAERDAFCARFDLPTVPAVALPGPIPSKPEDTLTWLHATIGTSTRAAVGDHPPRTPEGVVIRTPDRSRIVKIRLEEYERMERLARR